MKKAAEGPLRGILQYSEEPLVSIDFRGNANSSILDAPYTSVIEGNLVTPWLTGRAGELNTVAIFVSVLFWGWLWGIWGLLLAVPIMVSIKAAADRIEALQPLGELLGR